MKQAPRCEALSLIFNETVLCRDQERHKNHGEGHEAITTQNPIMMVCFLTDEVEGQWADDIAALCAMPRSRISSAMSSSAIVMALSGAEAGLS